MSKITKEKLVKEKAVKVKGAPRLRIPGGGRRIKEIEDPAVAKKLSRFSSAAPSKIVEEGKPNHLSSSSARKSVDEQEQVEQDSKTLPTKPSRFSSSRKSLRRTKISDAASGQENEPLASGPEEKSLKPHLREKSFRRTSTVGGRMRKPITTDTSVNRENTNEESVLEEKSSKSFRRKSSVGGRMRKPVGASVSSGGGQEAAEPHRPVSRTRGRARVREDEERQDVDKISKDQIGTSEESADVETEEKEDKGTSQGRVRAPPSLASVVRHR